MFKDDTDREWERWGASDPYYGVRTQDSFRQANLTDEAKVDFFESGKEHIDHILKTVRRHIDSDCRPKRVLDFGCGVGRLTIPLAAIAEHVTGIDVSESMLNEARKNCRSRAIENVEFQRSDAPLPTLDGKYDLINSFIVFQHIPALRGERIFQRLLDHLEDGGIIVAHFTYAKSHDTKGLSHWKRGLGWAKTRIPFVRGLVNLIRSRIGRDPEIQMNTYSLNRISLLMQRNNVREYFAEFTDHGGELGLLVFCQKPRGGP